MIPIAWWRLTTWRIRAGFFVFHQRTTKEKDNTTTDETKGEEKKSVGRILESLLDIGKEKGREKRWGYEHEGSRGAEERVEIGEGKSEEDESEKETTKDININISHFPLQNYVEGATSAS